MNLRTIDTGCHIKNVNYRNAVPCGATQFLDVDVYGLIGINLAISEFPKWRKYLILPGISDLLAPDGTFIHPRAAERTKFCSAHNRAAPEAVI